MPAVPDHSADVALLWCVLLNAAVFGSAYRWAARRWTVSRSQAACDAALLGYAVQYVAVAGPGVLGLLRPGVVVAVAVALSIGMWTAAGAKRPSRQPWPWLPLGVGLFAAAVVVGYAWNQADLPVVSNDALTYHFPAAAQWLQQGRLATFPTWFFNPANGYSPLAGSTFVAWLIVPFGSDVLARFVQVPALLCVGLGVYRLGRQLSAGAWAAAAVAAAAVLCRPLFTAALMGKDDLFVAFAFVATLVALSPERSGERFGPARVGLSLGLLLATKYTALLAVPMLLPALRRPRRPRRWVTAAAVAAAVAGPWYVRNAVATGNPLFPLDASPLFRGLFTAARSDGLGSPAADWHVVVGGRYGVPGQVLLVAAVGWAATAVARRSWADPVRRACLMGPLIGVALFAWRSPFPEVRFLFPALLPMLAMAGPFAVLAAALPVAAVRTLSVPGGWALFATLVPAAAAVAVGVVAVARGSAGRPWRGRLALATGVVAAGLFADVRWTAYCRRQADPASAEVAYASTGYPTDALLWRFVNDQLPADATVAYADLYLVYPLQGPALRRRLTYVPTRHGVRTPADLPWLGEHLSGERLVTAATAATVADPDRSQWHDRLRQSGAAYLVVGNIAGGPEAAWAAADPARFTPLYAGPGGRVFAVNRSSVAATRTSPALTPGRAR